MGAGAGGAEASRAGRGGRRRRAVARPMSEINVTPMVDVMLVLLIIFMVAAPLLTVGVPLDLPQTEARALPTPQEEPLTVNLDGAGRIFVQDQPVEAGALIPRLEAIRGARRTEQIFLRADRALAYGAVAEVMGALSRAGFTRIGLVTDQPPQER